ncbi:Uma2 family endonuclease [Aurantimonas sp. VKM B-3413]|uniref:Uma2 family endonuclease n=1 Tax=Aurantimonas sp. VKM B-3413 TaxID=2779401 RepID=UPI001E56F60E|nr:Uma2 family endonuclease [Aurantimonas sp. VKM B-3413]MCB8840585.1 Uma2 family endonuclease [Aurantimonas sp. VKM B-3413]
MNIQAPAIRTADDFLRWNEGREGRREFVRGSIVEMMTGGTRRHAELMLQLAIVLKSALASSDYMVVAADYAIRTPVGVRYPDVLVEPAAASDDKSLATDQALLIAEILSPSSLATDFGEKAQEYTALGTLRHYLVLSQDEPRVWLWSRGGDGAFAKPEMIVGADETIDLAGLHIRIPLAELYRGVA